MGRSDGRGPAGVFLRPGSFEIGCNYWASHAGTAMWTDWQPRVVERDLRRLAARGLKVLRVFPLWSDFQPLELLRGYAGHPRELRVGGQPLAGDEAGGVGLAPVMVERFDWFVRCAERHGLGLVVGLVTGWMSGRLFVPPAFEGLNVLADPVAIRWQVRFVRAFVRRFRAARAVVAWDLGNECNCMGTASRDQAWLWAHAVASAVRAEDAARPLVSGMHGLQPAAAAGAWTIQDQAELTDILTVHPYPVFTPHCDRDPVDTIRPLLHGAAEASFYADIGGRPCMVEETGTLGPLLASEATAGRFARGTLLSAWAHDARALLWWCAFDQDRLTHAPYDWCAYERELGLFRAGGAPKPAAREFAAFARFLAGLPFAALHPRARQAVCIVTPGPDAWGAAFGAFILAKQAGFDIEFQSSDQPLKPARLYLAPSVTGDGFSRRAWLALLERVRAGAALYVSGPGAVLQPFNRPFGVEVQSREQRAGAATLDLEGEPGPLSVASPVRLTLAARGAEVLAREPDGNPILTRARFGAGTAFFLGVPLETSLVAGPGTFTGPAAAAWARLYRTVGRPALAARVVRRDDLRVGLTEHPLGPRERVVVAINYSPRGLEAPLALKAGWSVSRCWRGEVLRSDAGPAVRLAPNDGAVFSVRRGA